MSSEQTGTPSDADASRTRGGLLADWSVAASHLIESSAVGVGEPMLDALCNGCDLPKVDLIGLWNESSTTDTEPLADEPSTAT